MASFWVSVVRYIMRLRWGDLAAPVSDSQVLDLAGVPSLPILVRIRRLLYFSRLLRFAPVFLLAQLQEVHASGSSPWHSLLAEDLDWFRGIVPMLQLLPFVQPGVSLHEWIELARDYSRCVRP